ncbi:hypothetical protein J6590_033505 [Homalodisca vitripennis]|nr:hypothetical protein J6590_033505 [Homalodisca vitripennis]
MGEGCSVNADFCPTVYRRNDCHVKVAEDWRRKVKPPTMASLVLKHIVMEREFLLEVVELMKHQNSMRHAACNFLYISSTGSRPNCFLILRGWILIQPQERQVTLKSDSSPAIRKSDSINPATTRFEGGLKQRCIVSFPTPIQTPWMTMMYFGHVEDGREKRFGTGSFASPA